MINITVNEKNLQFEEGKTLLDVKEAVKPDADVIIINGFQTTENTEINKGDSIALIKKGEIPSREEMEFLMAARHTPGIHSVLKKSSAAVAGLGGLGSNIAINLARMGVGRLKIIDFDVVEPSNLNRQQYFIHQIGKNKVDALLETLQQINPYLEYECENIYITEDKVEEIFLDYQVVLEAFDKAENKAMLIGKFMRVFPEKCIIGASGVAGIYDTRSIGIRQLGQNAYIVGDLENEARPGRGLMSTRVAVAAGIQSNLAVRYLTGDL
ncbi:sulfur carrier protein ThiS adenylyltransferase ThiF [Flexistipes sinusarabici]|uniref:sulfur carrier protein ThiS adenylyltransferase ThiF n=1 Tax=Flexistipes sinusarabici TaxID=2352 RepID=UPI002351F845|nr:sulfur carrier protein ThiS adenylyltransferase ThiF [Flexistipes sinusarabici]